MKTKNTFVIRSCRSVSVAIIAIIIFSWTASAQSSDLAFPSAVTENQLSGLIKARDIGDSRVTTYYYTFNGTQGDLFVNVVTKNLSGSIDVFAAEGMRPLTRIMVYADLSSSETGRVVYLRKPEKLILRVEGRTPNDDPAEFQIKFAGGFEAAVPKSDEPPVPKVTDQQTNDSGVRVNSVGTIVAVIPKPTPSVKQVSQPIRKTDDVTKETVDESKADARETKVDKDTESGPPSDLESKEKTNIPAAEENKASIPSAKRTSAKSSRTPRVKPERPVADDSNENTTASRDEAVTSTKNPRVTVTDSTKPLPLKKPDPLENVRLVILFKDGTKVERPMTEVLRFTADQSTLTVVNKNGRISRFSILDVASVSIQ